MPCERSRFAADPFHHVAIAAEGVHVVVEKFEVRAVEIGRQPLSAIAMPTLFATPCPSGPVVVSTPVVR